MFKSILSLALVSFLISCDNDENAKLIIGSWKCVQWNVADKTNASSSKDVSFKFNADKTYDYHNSTLNESGTYKISRGKLYTTPKGELEIAVDIDKLTADSMIFNMSRGGTPETMILVKEEK